MKYLRYFSQHIFNNKKKQTYFLLLWFGPIQRIDYILLIMIQQLSHFSQYTRYFNLYANSNNKNGNKKYIRQLKSRIARSFFSLPDFQLVLEKQNQCLFSVYIQILMNVSKRYILVSVICLKGSKGSTFFIITNGKKSRSLTLLFIELLFKQEYAWV